MLERLKAFLIAARGGGAEWRDFLSAAQAYLEEQQARCHRFTLGEWERFHYDQVTGKLVFFQDENPKVVADCQLVGSFSNRSRTWLWSWANPAVLTQASEELKRVAGYGTQHGFAKLFEGKWAGDEGDGWAMTAAAAFILESKGAYACPFEGGVVYLVFTEVDLAVEDPLTAGLLVEVDPEIEDVLLDDWRWLVGDDATVFRATLFGDLFTRTPDGHIHWLDTSFGSYEEVAESAEGWAQAARVHGSDWFNLRALRELRSLGAGLTEGQVYSWGHPPMLGGARTVDNVTFTPLTVHANAAGRLAFSVKDLPPGAKITEVRWTPLS